MPKKRNERKINELFKELEEYEDTDLHDQNVILDLKGIVEELQDAGWKGEMGDLLDYISDEYAYSEDKEEQEEAELGKQRIREQGKKRGA